MSIRYNILNALKEGFESIQENANYEIAIAEVSQFDEAILTEEDHNVPLLMIIDTGKETLPVRDSTHYRYRAN